MKHTASLVGHEAAVNTIRFNSTGDLLVSGASDDTKVRLWDARRARAMQAFDSGHSSPINDVRWLPDTNDHKLVTCAADCQVRVVDLERMAIKPFQVHKARVRSLAPISSEVFLSAGEDGTVRLLDLRIRQPARDAPQSPFSDRTLLVEQRSERAGRSSQRVGVHSLAVEPMRPWIFATGGGDPLVRIFDQRMMPGPPKVGGGSSRKLTWTCCLVPAHLKSTATGALSKQTHISGITYSASGRELVASYSGENIYSFRLPEHGQSPQMLLSTNEGLQYGSGWGNDSSHAVARSGGDSADTAGSRRRGVGSVIVGGDGASGATAGGGGGLPVTRPTYVHQRVPLPLMPPHLRGGQAGPSRDGFAAEQDRAVSRPPLVNATRMRADHHLGGRGGGTGRADATHHPASGWMGPLGGGPTQAAPRPPLLPPPRGLPQLANRRRQGGAADMTTAQMAAQIARAARASRGGGHASVPQGPSRRQTPAAPPAPNNRHPSPTGAAAATVPAAAGAAAAGVQPGWRHAAASGSGFVSSGAAAASGVAPPLRRSRSLDSALDSMVPAPLVAPFQIVRTATPGGTTSVTSGVGDSLRRPPPPPHLPPPGPARPTSPPSPASTNAGELQSTEAVAVCVARAELQDTAAGGLEPAERGTVAAAPASATTLRGGRAAGACLQGRRSKAGQRLDGDMGGSGHSPPHHGGSQAPTAPGGSSSRGGNDGGSGVMQSRQAPEVEDLAAEPAGGGADQVAGGTLGASRSSSPGPPPAARLLHDPVNLINPVMARRHAAISDAERRQQQLVDSWADIFEAPLQALADLHSVHTRALEEGVALHAARARALAEARGVRDRALADVRSQLALAEHRAGYRRALAGLSDEHLQALAAAQSFADQARARRAGQRAAVLRGGTGQHAAPLGDEAGQSAAPLDGGARQGTSLLDGGDEQRPASSLPGSDDDGVQHDVPSATAATREPFVGRSHDGSTQHASDADPGVSHPHDGGFGGALSQGLLEGQGRLQAVGGGGDGAMSQSMQEVHERVQALHRAPPVGSAARPADNLAAQRRASHAEASPSGFPHTYRDRALEDPHPTVPQAAAVASQAGVDDTFGAGRHSMTALTASAMEAGQHAQGGPSRPASMVRRSVRSGSRRDGRVERMEEDDHEAAALLQGIALSRQRPAKRARSPMDDVEEPEAGPFDPMAAATTAAATWRRLRRPALAATAGVPTTAATAAPCVGGTLGDATAFAQGGADHEVQRMDDDRQAAGGSQPTASPQVSLPAPESPLALDERRASQGLLSLSFPPPASETAPRQQPDQLRPSHYDPTLPNTDVGPVCDILPPSPQPPGALPAAEVGRPEPLSRSWSEPPPPPSTAAPPTAVLSPPPLARLGEGPSSPLQAPPQPLDQVSSLASAIMASIFQSTLLRQAYGRPPAPAASLAVPPATSPAVPPATSAAVPPAASPAVPVPVALPAAAMASASIAPLAPSQDGPRPELAAAREHDVLQAMYNEFAESDTEAQDRWPEAAPQGGATTQARRPPPAAPPPPSTSSPSPIPQPVAATHHTPLHNIMPRAAGAPPPLRTAAAGGAAGSTVAGRLGTAAVVDREAEGGERSGTGPPGGVRRHDAEEEDGAVAASYLRCYRGHRNVSTPKEVSVLGPHSSHVLSGSDDGHVFVWDLQQGHVVTLLPAHEDSIVNSVQAHPHDPLLVTAGTDSVVRLWSPESEERTGLSASAVRLIAHNLEDLERRARVAQRPDFFHLLGQLGQGGHAQGSVAFVRMMGAAAQRANNILARPLQPPSPPPGGRGGGDAWDAAPRRRPVPPTAASGGGAPGPRLAADARLPPRQQQQQQQQVFLHPQFVFVPADATLVTLNEPDAVNDDVDEVDAPAVAAPRRAAQAPAAAAGEGSGEGAASQAAGGADAARRREGGGGGGGAHGDEAPPGPPGEAACAFM